MKILSTIGLLLALGMSSFAQLVGIVQDDAGEPLPYVSIYIQNTSTGTTTNASGEYILPLQSGTYQINYRFIGFETQQIEVVIGAGEQIRNVTLQPQATLLNEFVVAADAEDPAYSIIRKAIAKRDFYKDYFSSYSCDVYVKGNQKIENVPEKFMGQEIGDLDGALDSNRQGIVYLSESISQLHVDGNNYKEVITSSKISGDDRGYSFNSAKEMEFNFYENTITLERQMVTPIADNALAYYRYKLEGTFYDDGGRLINEITVIPKRKRDPAFSGKIYIVEDEWSIHSLKLSVTGAASKVYVLDSLTFNQVFIPIEGSEGYAIFSNTISFGMTIFGVSLNGTFGAIYSQYDMKPHFEKDFFDSYVHVVEEESNERDSVFWEEVRPLPLTIEEVVDYKKRDSITTARKDPMYMDSIDRAASKFNFGSILGGYSYRRRTKQFYLDVESPISNLNFNTVQGYNAALKVEGRKYFDEDETRRILFGAETHYGFSEKKVRANGYFLYRPSRINRQQISITGGTDLVQFNRQEPISPMLNGLYSLLLKDNYAKYFDLKYIRLRYFHEPAAGIFLTHTLSWEGRSPLSNNTNHSYFKREESYSPNEISPNTNLGEIHLFENHQALTFDVSATIRFNQKYMLFPDRKFNAGADGPLLQLSYTGAYAIGGADVKFQKIAASLSDEWEVGVGGRLQWYVNAGTYLNNDRVELPDFRHFMGNQIFFTKDGDYRRSFLMLPYYEHSTDKSYLQVHLQHHFDGWIMDKLPLLRDLGWSFVAGAKHLRTTNRGGYSEFHLGLDNIGYKFIRLIRVDGVMSIEEGNTNWGVRMSLGF